MSDISNRAAYLQGLADGLKLDTETTEGQLLAGILDLLNDVAEELEMLDDEQGFIVDKIDELEEVVEIIGDEAFGYDDEDDFYTLVCENCGAEIDLTGDDLDDIADGVFKCPDCGEVIELDLDDCDCDCDCGCDCGCEH
jgi:hypothetical protein